MNKYEHASNSAKIFGGKATDYEEFHALIDSNKTVTPSIFGRFFLHHFDIGLILLEKVFGKNIGSKKIPLKELLAQHLIEDYGQLITFKEHWLPALKINEKSLPKISSQQNFVDRANTDTRLRGLSTAQLNELDSIFRLHTWINESVITFHRESIAVLGHALGADLITRILPKKFHGKWTLDVVTGYLNCRFDWLDKNRDGVPTLLDWERFIPDETWMHSPSEDKKNKLSRKKIQELINKQTTDFNFADFVENRPMSSFYKRQPCNFD
jgi:hypothetical protein